MSRAERMVPQSRGRVAARSAPGRPVAAVRTGSATGRPLPEAVRTRMEAAFGADFSGVTVREDGAAAAMGAAAFTRGGTIMLHPGLYDRYDSSSPEGLEVLGHELAHVLQQRAGRVPGTGVTEDPALEAEADEAGQRAAHGEPVRSEVGAPSGDIAAVASAATTAPQTGVTQRMRVADLVKKFNALTPPADVANGPSAPQQDYVPEPTEYANAQPASQQGYVPQPTVYANAQPASQQATGGQNPQVGQGPAQVSVQPSAVQPGSAPKKSGWLRRLFRRRQQPDGSQLTRDPRRQAVIF